MTSPSTGLPKRVTVTPEGPLRGQLRLPGDKSISHRALIFGALAPQGSRIEGLLEAGDVAATQAAVEALGAEVVVEGPGRRTVRGPARLQEPVDVVDCGNSGTSIRLLCGLLAGIDGLSVLTGDSSLRRRPMARVVEPLRRMGATVDGREGGRLAPLSVRGGGLRSVAHDLPIASAQVKSSLLLAGLSCGVSVREPRQSRDHTERFLAAMGAPVARDADGWLHLAGGQPLRSVDVTVPADISSAAFLLAAASLIPGSEVHLPGVGLNPTRTGVVDALRAMGADIDIVDEVDDGLEPRGTLVVRHAPLRGARIDGELALRSLDELPVLSVAAAFASGPTTIADAAELRVKESDRIARVAAGLRSLGVTVDERPDGMTIHPPEGGPVGPATIDASGDHRLAMSFAVAGRMTPGGVTIEAADAVASSWPGFYEALAALSGSSGGA